MTGYLSGAVFVLALIICGAGGLALAFSQARHAKRVFKSEIDRSLKRRLQLVAGLALALSLLLFIARDDTSLGWITWMLCLGVSHFAIAMLLTRWR